MNADGLSAYKRIVIKIGSSLLVDPGSGLKRQWLNSLVEDIALLRSHGQEVLVVSSGSIALGRGILGLKKGPLKLEESQAAASVGQIALARAYHDSLAQKGFEAGQILLTLSDTEKRRRYLNARATIETLLKLGAVPIINENDTVATSEIRYGDNDRLAARVATMMTGDLLILLSDIDGLYSAPPQENPDAQFIDRVEKITPAIEAMAGDVGTELSRGGMVTKIEAGKIATAGGTAMVIASGKKLNPIASLCSGGRATWFSASGNPVSSRKKWIAGQLATNGKLHLDPGAERALLSGKSLLPAGVRRADGNFLRGDVVSVLNIENVEIARGLVAYDCDQAQAICGLKSTEIAERLGFSGRAEMIHRDDLVLLHNAKIPVESR